MAGDAWPPDGGPDAPPARWAASKATPPEPDPKDAELARAWAEAHRLAAATRAARATPLLDALRTQDDFLRAARRHFIALARGTQANSYAAEWFLDNFYLIQESIVQVLHDLPPEYYRQLPALAEAAPVPRVYALALELIDESDARLDLDRVERFVAAYQRTAPLTMGELWALPTMLRMGLLDRLSRSVRRLTDVAAPLPPLEPGGESDDQRVANCIVGLRALKTNDWERFFEQLSLVERALRTDPGGTYGQTDFATRDRYRKVVERVAARSGVSEVAVAAAAVRMAAAAAEAGEGADGAAAAPGLPAEGSDPAGPASVPPSGAAPDAASARRGHAGYYLIDEGVRRLHAAVGYRATPGERARQWAFDHAATVYLGSALLLALVLVVGLVRYAEQAGSGVVAGLVVVLLAVVPSLTVAVGILNLLLGRSLPPRVLPKLDFSEAIPDACATAVVVPALITDAEEVDALLERLERHYLGNPQPQLRFALLTDFADAPEATQPSDEALLGRAIDGIQRLNDRYGRHASAPFFLFHRERRWNPAEGVWMGWERKRGKLTEFNRLVRGRTDTSYTVQVGDLSRLPAVRYVLTLDADTRLPPAAAHRLVGTLAHPLNRAEFDAAGRVKAGYSLLQPRTDILPESANSSLFSRLFVGEHGLDLYTLAVSDVYQDFFGEGIYVGKGLYHVDDFERALAGRVPENALLSHDLLEGLYGRVALVSDVVLFEEYPPNYLAQVLRSQRWVRGDWQLLPWLAAALRRGNAPAAPPVGAMGAWKIFDNLRRSLLMPALLAFLLLGWTWLPGAPLVWTLVALLTLAVPLLGEAAAAVARTLAGMAAGQGRTLRPWRALANGVRRYAVTLSFVPFEALVAGTSVAITLYRLLVTRRHLLRWRTAALTSRMARSAGVPAMLVRLAPALALTLLIGATVVLVRPMALPVALPLLALWLASPWIAYGISRPPDEPAAELGEEARERLHALARRTWLYFEHHVGPEDNWLPPDNVQEAPMRVTAHRTSPTNIGLLLLSTLAAHDLGYVGILDLSLRLRQTLEVLDRMERYRGHLLNWYDTRSLLPLAPRYVSSVDSGNLAGSLVALRQGCLELLAAPVMLRQRWRGLRDVVGILSDVLTGVEGEDGAALAQRLEEFRRRIRTAEDDPGSWPEVLAYLAGDGWTRLQDELIELMSSGALAAASLTDLRLWSERVGYNIKVTQREFDFLLPWTQALADAAAWSGALEPGSEARAAWGELRATLAADPRLDELVTLCGRGREGVARLRAALGRVPRAREPRAPEQPARAGEPAAWQAQADAWCENLTRRLVSAEAAAKGLMESFRSVADMAEANLRAMDFAFLFDAERQQLHIGYNVDVERLDANHYDLLASESRVASLVGIATNDLPVSHWLHLGRPLTDIGGRATLLSWSGTMFEYLMPALLTRRYPGTLLEQSCQAALTCQIDYARRKGVPWGISESGYARVDASGTYQYQAFGVPDLALDRGLESHLVIAPYASVLALPLRPDAVLANMTALERAGALGSYGYYEALDFTPSRRPLAQESAVVRSHMAHHQGMILVALANALSDDAMVRRFHADPRVATVELLLQERIPAQVAPAVRPGVPEPRPAVHDGRVAERPWPVAIDSEVPSCHVLSNGRYAVLLTAAGGGYSALGDTALTRWHADTTLDALGSWLYLRDVDDGRLWSVTRQPMGVPAEHEEVAFWPHKAEFQRVIDGILVTLAVTVGEADAELRHVTLTNQGDRPRRLELTSYAEVVLAPQAADQRHPAFNKLFIESAYLEDQAVLLFRRRPRASSETPIYLGHTLLGAQDARATRYESDRARFLGRGRTARMPLGPSVGLSGTTGATLDPVMALSQPVVLEPHSRTSLTFVTAVARTRGELLLTLQRLRQPGMVERAFETARARGELEARRTGLTIEALVAYQQLLSALIYPSPALRAPAPVLAANELGQAGLWGHAISGDYPILLVRIKHQEETPLVAELVRAHGYWRRRGVKVDVVVLNTKDSAYDQEMQGQLRWILSRTGGDDWLDARGGIYLLRADQIDPAELVLLESVARVVLDGGAGTLAAQLGGLRARPSRLPLHVPTAPATDGAEPLPVVPRPTGLLFDNGVGGFTPDGREYVVYLADGRLPPAPWSNVVANEDFGFLTTEAGMGASWAVNAGENRLTPWGNDPVSDTPAEMIYLRDEETAELWSATPLPCPGPEPYLVRHGAGFTSYEHHGHGLRHLLQVFAAVDEPVKVALLRVTNARSVPRRITVTYYAPWVLGVDRSATQLHVLHEYSTDHCALLARNPYNSEFAGRVAFLASNKTPHGVTTDRGEFLGRLGSEARPAALSRIGLSGTTRAGTDPCAVLQLHLDLPPGGAEEVVFALGQAADRDGALRLADAFRDPSGAATARQRVTDHWDALLGHVQVATPDPAMNLLTNRWLLYQALASRIWGRTGLYQPGGAYGFRDQLQDVLAVFHAAPEVARAQLLRASAHQFEEGDVLHWWHPPSGRGVRTRITDDLLWLPFVVAGYVEATGDVAVLEEQVPFLRGDPLAPEQHEHYAHFETTAEHASVLEHCRRALRQGATQGRSGLPLMGGGDWNDGMNRVGIEGRGESVWLAWFLIATLKRFAALCARIGEGLEAERYRAQAEDYRRAVEAVAWDGEWYLRAFFDDGSPLGSHRDLECRIDSIAQSWAVLSGAGDPGRTRRAMAAVDAQLVREDDGLIRLFTPAFDRTVRDPGYIKGYLPGIRENGGQYTHGAIWTAWAFAELGEGDRAGDLYRMLNPIHHGADASGLERYKVEPYVVAADVYGLAPHVGRGGWTWYTGSAAWLYRLGLEGILGLTREGASDAGAPALRFDPCIPSSWPGFTVRYQEGATRYLIEVDNAAGVSRGILHLRVDGEPVLEGRVVLHDDGGEHRVEVVMGRAVGVPSGGVRGGRD